MDDDATSNTKDWIAAIRGNEKIDDADLEHLDVDDLIEQARLAVTMEAEEEGMEAGDAEMRGDLAAIELRFAYLRIQLERDEPDHPAITRLHTIGHLCRGARRELGEASARRQFRALCHGQQGRARRLATNTRTKGSKRAGASSQTSSADPGEPEPEPERPLNLWRHPDYGDVSPNLYRLLIRGRK